AFLKLVTNPRDELSFKRLAQLLPGIGGKGADKLWKIFSGQMGDGKWEMAGQKPSAAIPQLPASYSHLLAAALQRCAKGVPKKAAIAWAQFAVTISQLAAGETRKNVSRMITLV